MKYYVVSEEELDNLYTADSYEKDEADAKCRARPVIRGKFDRVGQTISAWEEV